MSLKIAIFYGSVRSDRQGIKGAKFLVNQCRERGHEVHLFDPMEYKLPLLDKMYKEYDKGQAPEILESMAEIIRQADGYITVCGEYNHSIPPALSNMMDHFLEEYFYKPSAIACYSPGPFGGVRAAMQMRAFLGEIGTPSISSIFPMSAIHKSFDNDGNALDDAYPRRAKRFLAEFEWYAEACKARREQGLPQ